MVTTNAKAEYYQHHLVLLLNGTFGVTDFAGGETITGQSSGATATVGTLVGSKIITQNFDLIRNKEIIYDIKNS